MSKRYGLMTSIGRNRPYSPERMRTQSCARAAWSAVKSQARRYWYAGPLNASAHGFCTVDTSSQAL
eukprot:366117-Chlamydomonas_euryale.AAC.2